MKKILFIFYMLCIVHTQAQTKADQHFKKMETYDYSGLSKASIKYRIVQNKNEDMTMTLKETPDTFFVYFTKIFYADTINKNLYADSINIKLHKLTFNANDTCMQDISTFLFSQDFESDANFYSRACCVKWSKTNIRNLYVSTFKNKKTMTIKKADTKPFLTIIYNYYPKMTEREYHDFLTGNINW